jgi:hypothetical protein
LFLRWVLTFLVCHFFDHGLGYYVEGKKSWDFEEEVGKGAHWR